MKQGKHYFDMLSEEEKEQYMELIKKELLERNYTSFEDFLPESFVFENPPIENPPIIRKDWFRVNILHD